MTRLLSCSDTWKLETQDPLLRAVVRDLVRKGIFEGTVNSENLLVLGKRLDLTSERRKLYNGYVFKLTDLMQKFATVSRFYVAGAYSCKVEIGSPNIDLVVFLPCEQYPPYDKDANDLLYRFQKNLASELNSNRRVKVYPVIPQTEHNPSYIYVKFHEANIHIYLAPCVGSSCEEQRQACYELMQLAYSRGGISAVIPWYPALIERPSEILANEQSDVHAFIRICLYWTKTLNLNFLSVAAVTTLALQIVKKTRGHQEASSKNIDVLVAFRKFLECCSDIQKVNSLCSIESPACYVSVSSSQRIRQPSLFNSYNPYCNLLSSLSKRNISTLQKRALSTLSKLEKATDKKKPQRSIKLKHLFIRDQGIFNCFLRFFFRLLFRLLLYTFSGYILILIIAWGLRSFSIDEWNEYKSLVLKLASSLLNVFEVGWHYLSNSIKNSSITDLYRRILYGEE